MWLEEMAWLWVPVAGLCGAWVIRLIMKLRAEVRALSTRVEALESTSSGHPNEAQKVV